MKILLVNPGGERYGSDRMLVATARALAVDGHQLVAAVGAPGPLIEALAGLGVPVQVVASPVLRRGRLTPLGLVVLAGEVLLRSLGVVRLLLRSRPDVAVVNTVTIPLWIWWARALRVPVIAHVHEAEGQLPPVAARLLYAGLRPAARIVVNSEYTRGVLLAAYPGAEPRIRMVRNCVAGPPVVTRPRSRLEGPVRLAYVGRLSQRKGVALAVHAVRILRGRGRDARLQIAGGVFGENDEFLERLLADAGGLVEGAVVEFSGEVEEPWETLAHADIALVPSVMPESFGNSAIEAGLAARPVVVSMAGGLLEAAADRRAARLVAPGDAEAIALAVEEWAAAWDEIGAAALAEAAGLRELYGFDRYRNSWGSLIGEFEGEAESN